MMGLMVEPLLAEQAETGLIRDFGTWMASEQRRVYALCQHFLQDRDDADCATQDVFLKAYQAIQREDAKALDDPARWLTRIAVNTCLDRLRSRKWQIWRRRPSPEDEAAILAMTASQAPESEAQCFAGEISLEEIGKVLGLDVGTVKAHMFRAVGKLREDLRDLYGSRMR